MIVNNNAAAVLLVLAALAAGRDVPVSRGESVEIGGGFRVPEVMEQSGARLVDVGTTNRTRLADYRRAVDAAPTWRSCSRCTRATTASTGSSRTRRSPSWRRSARPSSSTSAAGSLDATCPWWPGPHPPPWLAGEPAAVRRSPPAPPSSRSAATSCSADRRRGSSPVAADLVERCGRHPLARALRPGGLVLAALQDLALAYLRRDVVTTIPFWRMAAAPVDELRARAAAIAAATGAEPVATDALPGAGSAPGATIPSFGVRLAGDHLAALRAHDPPVIARGRDGVDGARPARRRPRRRRRASSPRSRRLRLTGRPRAQASRQRAIAVGVVVPSSQRRRRVAAARSFGASAQDEQAGTPRVDRQAELVRASGTTPRRVRCSPAMSAS